MCRSENRSIDKDHSQLLTVLSERSKLLIFKDSGVSPVHLSLIADCNQLITLLPSCLASDNVSCVRIINVSAPVSSRCWHGVEVNVDEFRHRNCT